MEPSLQPSFTFPSRHELANRATGLEAELNMSYVHSVPKRSTDVSIETGLNRADIIVPMGQKETLDPIGILPISENIYVQPGIAEGLTNASRADNAELTIMKTLSSNNALKRGNYQAAEHILGRGTTVEEVQNQTTVPNKRPSQLGGPDIHIGSRSQHIGAPVRTGANYQSMAHIISQLGDQIDVLAQQYNIPADQVIRLKTRYNLFTPADPSAQPNVPGGWKSIWELIKRDIEGIRTGTSNLRSNAAGSDNAQRQAAGNPGHPNAFTGPSAGPSAASSSNNPPRSAPVPDFTVHPNGNAVHASDQAMADDLSARIHRAAQGDLSGGKIKGGVIRRSGRGRTPQEESEARARAIHIAGLVHSQKEQLDKLDDIPDWSAAQKESFRQKLVEYHRLVVDNHRQLSAGEIEEYKKIYDYAQKIWDKRVKREGTRREQKQQEDSARAERDDKDNNTGVTIEDISDNKHRGNIDEDAGNYLDELNGLAEKLYNDKGAQKDPNNLSWVDEQSSILEQYIDTYKGKWKKVTLANSKVVLGNLQLLRGDIEKSLSSVDAPNVMMEDDTYTENDKQQDVQNAPTSSGTTVDPTDQDKTFERPAGNSTADFTGNNQINAEQDAGMSQEQREAEEFPAPPPSEVQLPPADNPVIQEYMVQGVNLTHREDSNRDEQAAIYAPYDREINRTRHHPSFMGGGLRGRGQQEFISDFPQYNLSRPTNWSIKTQLQNPVSHTEHQDSLAKKARYVLTEPPETPHRNYTLNTYNNKNRRINAPLSEQLMTRTGHNAIPISAQVQTSASNNHGLWETNVRQFAREPSRAGEEIKNAFMPQPPPQEMYSKPIGSTDPSYGTYDNTVPQGTGRTQKRPFGKHFIHIDKLFHQGIVSLSHANGKKVSRLRNETVARGSGIHAALCNLAQGKKPTKKMTAEEKVHLQSICTRSGVSHPSLQAGAINVDPLQELHIAMGEINAGNDAPGLRAQIRRLLTQLERSKKLSNAQISSIRTHYLA